MTSVFYILAALLILQGVLSLIEGFRFYTFVVNSCQRPKKNFTPKVSVIAPCKGLDAGFEENLNALFHLSYPDYEILFAVALEDDVSVPIILRVINKHKGGKARLVIAGRSDKRSEKVNNLLRAIEEARLDSQVFAFVDSDARVTDNWLHLLVEPLANREIGAATGYRWYLPERGGFFAALLSAWNGSVATTLGKHARNFAWGGSTAILKETYERLEIRRRWQQALSDDYALTNAVQQNHLRIAFVPQCMAVSREDASLAKLLEFTTRQVIITKIYNPRLWWVGLVTQFLFNAGLFGGVIFSLYGLLSGKDMRVLLLLLAAIYLLGCMKGVLRVLAARVMLPQVQTEILKLWWAYVGLWWCVSLVYLFNFIKSATTRKVFWRGIWYEMRSPEDTRILER